MILDNTLLIRVTVNLTHFIYSKGAVAIYELSELIGEEKSEFDTYKFTYCTQIFSFKT